MFSYYGAKTVYARYYPEPEYERIIEPFAGAAWYSLLYYTREVLLIEKDPRICSVWEWVLSATDSDISRLPDLTEKGDCLDHHPYLSPEERLLLGMTIGVGERLESRGVTEWGASQGPNQPSRVQRLKKRLFHYCPRIRHWRVLNKDYRQYKGNPKATWFIDPPYKGLEGRFYKMGGIDYGFLAKWAQSRRGQVIVCGGSDCDYLPFQPLLPEGKKRKAAISRGKHSSKTGSIERVWTNA